MTVEAATAVRAAAVGATAMSAAAGAAAVSAAGPGANVGRPASPWTLYDRFLAEIPEPAVVRRYLVGQSWTVVAADGMGLSMTFPRPTQDSLVLRPSRAGLPLRDLTADLRSWDFSAASLALAAVNSHYNRPERLEALTGRTLIGSDCPPVFETVADEVAGQKVAVIGHFPDLEPLAERCALTILERSPKLGDLPDPACEYLLPRQDYVFITGVTIINKTLPRLLELSAGARVVLVGPSVPFSPIWFDLGLYLLAGSVVTDPDRCWTTTCEGGAHEIWARSAAVRLQLRAEDFRADPAAAKPPVDNTAVRSTSREDLVR